MTDLEDYCKMFFVWYGFNEYAYENYKEKFPEFTKTKEDLLERLTWLRNTYYKNPIVPVVDDAIKKLKEGELPCYRDPNMAEKTKIEIEKLVLKGEAFLSPEAFEVSLLLGLTNYDNIKELKVTLIDFFKVRNEQEKLG